MRTSFAVPCSVKGMLLGDVQVSTPRYLKVKKKPICSDGVLCSRTAWNHVNLLKNKSLGFPVVEGVRARERERETESH